MGTSSGSENLAPAYKNGKPRRTKDPRNARVPQKPFG